MVTPELSEEGWTAAVGVLPRAAVGRVSLFTPDPGV